MTPLRPAAPQKKWAMLTAYDAPTAQILEEAGVDFILVGDSVGMVLLGYPSTREVTMDEMIHHARAVRRGAPDSFVIGDLPLKGVEKGPRLALASAQRFMKEGGCDAVKLEWGRHCLEALDLMRRHRIPVLGHVGLTPQTAATKEGFKVQGQEAGQALKIFRQAKLLEKHGAFGVLLECVPRPVAKAITAGLSIPTIGIGAGPDCSGQVLVFHDMVGLFKKFSPRFVKRYANIESPMRRAAERFVKEVHQGTFPTKKHSYEMKREEFQLFQKAMNRE